MLRVESITLREIRLPLVQPFRSAGGMVTERRMLLLTLTDTDGTIAWSECVAEALPSYSSDTVDTCWLAISEWVAPRVLGREFASPADVHPALTTEIRGHHMAIAAVEMGMWALAAMQAGQPLASHLVRHSFAAGGDAEPRPDVKTGIAIGIQADADATAFRARSAVEQGYRSIRMKIEPGSDLQHVRAARDAAGRDVRLVADANGSYSLDDPAHAAALRSLDEAGLDLIEQPLGPDELVRHSELQRAFATPICLDESITSPSLARDMIALGSARALNLKPGRVGGIVQAIAIHDICARSGIRMWCGGMLESGIGRAFNVALASLPAFTDPGDLSPSARYWERDIVAPEWKMDSQARVRVPLDRPGIGVDVDVDFVDALTSRVVVLRAS